MGTWDTSAVKSVWMSSGEKLDSLRLVRTRRMPQAGSESFTCGRMYFSEATVVPVAFFLPGFECTSAMAAMWWKQASFDATLSSCSSVDSFGIKLSCT